MATITRPSTKQLFAALIMLFEDGHLATKSGSHYVVEFVAEFGKLLSDYGLVKLTNDLYVPELTLFGLDSARIMLRKDVYSNIEAMIKHAEDMKVDIAFKSILDASWEMVTVHWT